MMADVGRQFSAIAGGSGLVPRKGMSSWDMETLCRELRIWVI